VAVSLASVSLVALAAAAADPALAQDAAPAASDAGPDDDYHNRTDDQPIVVTAAGLDRLDTLAGTSVMEGAELQRSLAGQVGDVLVKEPGVSATSFAPGVSRPVLRGFSGERVKVLVDGIGAIDISNTSADHAVSIDPLTAERIEVLRGPAVMLYGSQAIGGAVNVIDKRIPRRLPDEALHVDALGAFGTAADAWDGGASVDVPVGSRFAVHADGSWHRSSDLSIPGFAVAEPLRARLLAEAASMADADAAQALRDAAQVRGTLPGSATETWSANLGAALFAGGSNLGAAVGIYDTAYGIPTRPGTGEDDVSIALRQYRADLRGETDLGDGPFGELRTRVGYSDYTHTEFEGAEAGTVFDVQGLEARAELVQARCGTWQGSLGGQYYFRDFAASGEEAYIAPNETSQFALFALQEVTVGPIQLEGAGRFEQTSVSANTVGLDRRFTAWSGALSLAHETPGGLRFGVNLSRVARAPSAEELLANGAHVATQAFEIGDPALGMERAWGYEGFVRGKVGAGTLSLAVYRSDFSGYIYQQATGAEIDDLPVFQTVQRDARYTGIEGEFSHPLLEAGSFRVLADVRGDYIRASLTGGTPLPRIPPLSLLGALEAQSDWFDLRGEVQWTAAQNRVSPGETATDGFAFVNASVAWKPIRGDNSVTVLLQGDNLFDVSGRRAASFTKDYVPLPGRNIKLSVQASF
jgi:iron complex outermembrane receptor protein